MWLVSLALVAVAAWLFYGNALSSAMRGANEEAGLGLALVALALSLWGLGLRRSVRAWDARLALAGVAATAVVALTTLGLILTHDEPHGVAAAAAVSWERLDEAPPGAPEVTASLPAHTLDTLRRAVPGERGLLNLHPHEEAALAAALGGGGVGLCDGAPFRFELSAPASS